MSISVIGASDGVSQAVGQPADQVRQKVDVSNRWIAVDDELWATTPRRSAGLVGWKSAAEQK